MSQRIVAILVKRDGISEGEAEDIVQQVKEQLASIVSASNLDPFTGVMECEGVVADMLGLEPDYVEELMP